MTCPHCAKHEVRIAVLEDELHRQAEANRKLGGRSTEPGARATTELRAASRRAAPQ